MKKAVDDLIFYSVMLGLYTATTVAVLLRGADGWWNLAFVVVLVAMLALAFARVVRLRDALREVARLVER